MTPVRLLPRKAGADERRWSAREVSLGLGLWRPEWESRPAAGAGGGPVLDGASGLEKVKRHARKIVLEVDKCWCFLVSIDREVDARV